MDSLAAALGIDRAEIRRRNLIPVDAFPYETLTRQRYDSGDYVRALDLALSRSATTTSGLSRSVLAPRDASWASESRAMSSPPG